METIFRVCLFIAGVINFAPSLLAFLPKKLAASYGIQIPNVNYELLLRHRAVLFGIVGGIMIYSAISQKYYSLAVGIGLISMVSFVVLLMLVDGKVNAELMKVMWIDVAGIAILLFGFLLYQFS